MMRRASLATFAVILAGGLLAAPAEAQLARPRVARPDAPKVLVAPFVRDARDSAMSLVVADGARERLRTAHMDKFALISRANLNNLLTESGFPVDVPIDANNLRLVARHLNARFVLEGSMIRRANDSIMVVARLAEATGLLPQAATISLVESAERVGSRTGAEIANRLVEAAGSFDEVAECRRQVDLGNLPNAERQAARALQQFPMNAGAHLCIAQIREAQNAPEDSVIASLGRAYRRDTLATAVMRRLATKYQARNDTANLIDMLKRILTIDFRDNELRISTARLLVGMGRADSAVAVVNQGLEQNPASAELLGVKAIAMAAGDHWDSAAAALILVSEIDTARVDSLFFYRLTNYLRQAGDSAAMLRWTERATEKFPSQLDYWYTIASTKLVRGDSAGAQAAAEGLLRNVPAGQEDSPAVRGLYARANYVLAMLAQSRRAIDTAMTYADNAVRADSTIRPSVAVVYLLAGGQARADSNYTRAIELLTRAKEFGAANPRLLSPAAFQLGIAQFQYGARIDGQAQEGRSCDLARQAKGLIDSSETNIIAGVAANRELANQFLSNYIPAYKQRGDAMIRQYCRDR